MHGLCVFDNQISTMFVVYRFSKARLELLGYIEIVENGYRAVIELNDILLFGCDESQIVLDFVVDAAVVYMDAVVSGIEEIAQQCYGPAFLLEAELWSLCGLLYFANHVFPTLQQYLQLGIKFSCALSLGYCTYNNTEILWLDALNKLFQSATFFALLDFGRNRNTVLERNEHQITAGKTQLAGEAWTLGVNRFLYNLYQYFLTNLQGVGNAAILFKFWLDVGFLDRVELLAVAHYLFQIFLVRVKLSSQIKIMQECNTFGSDINETSVKSWHQLLDLCHINVAHRERCRALLLLVLYQLLILEQGNAYVLWLHINDNFTCHCFSP